MTTSKLSMGAILALTATGLFLTLVTAGIIATQSIPSNGTVTTVNVDVYSDRYCTQPCTSISWGTPYPGDSIQRTIYVKNTGSVPITISMDTENWVPTNAADYLTLTWDQGGTVLDVGDSVTATLTLVVDEDTTGLSDFSFDIVITGAE
jgi:hypothetical protein